MSLFHRSRADVICIDSNGQNPLHRASDYQMVVFLVAAAGANVSAWDERDRTAPTAHFIDGGQSITVEHFHRH